MIDSTKSKPSTGSDTGTRTINLRRFLNPPDASHLMDLYWGGPERRITGITVRIIAVNAVALVILMIGIMYLGRYQGNLIASTLETFQGNVELIAAGVRDLSAAEARQTAIHVASTRSFLNPETGAKRLMIFDADGRILADTHEFLPPDAMPFTEQKPELQSIATLKAMANFVIRLLPDNKTLPAYPAVKSAEGQDYPDVPDALAGRLSLSAWIGDDERIFLSAAAPVIRDGQVQGAVLVTRGGRDIEREVADVWIDVLRIFIGTLLITILLSIYLSGAIARPLRKLAKGAEAVRLGRAGAEAIPDFSDRHDDIGELSIVLRGMTQALSERLDSIERFAADVAHEIKNPLTSLRSAVETVVRVSKPEDRDKLLGIIAHDVQRMDRLISDISSASRLDTDLARESFDTVNMAALLHHALDFYQGPLERAGDPHNYAAVRSVAHNGRTISLEIRDGGHFYTEGIEGRLMQVFQNLLGNALSFTPPGGTIALTLQGTKNDLTVTVSDDGPGIPEAKLETIFERFYSERPGHEDYGRHSGLGLSICRQIAEAHRGRIFAENIVRDGVVKGAKFTVVLNRI